MPSELKIKISTTADARAVQDAINAIDGVEKVSKTASKEIDNTSSSFDKMASSVKNLIASYMGYSVISSVVKSGIELTGQFEQMKIGIASLIAVNSQSITSMGTHIDASQKFALAQKASAEAIQLLRKANLETPATLAELTRGFQSALGPAMALGMSINQTVKYSTLMTQAAAAMGVPMDQLSQEMASILNGNIDMNSVVAKNIGLTNEQVKAHIKQGDVYNFLIGKLSDFGSAGKEMSKSWSGVTSNLEDSWGQFKMTMVNDSGIFNVAKSGVIELTKVIQNQNGEIDTMTRYMKDATLAGSMLYGTVLAVDTIKAIRLAMGELTLAQYAFNVAARANPYIIAGTVVAGGLTYLYDQIQKGHNEVNLAGAKDGKGYADAFVISLKDSNPAQLSHDIMKQSQELKVEEESIMAKLKESKGFMKESSSNDQLILTLEKRRAAIRAEQTQLIEYNNALRTTLGQNTLIVKPHEKTDAEKKAEEEAKAKAEKASEKAAREAESLKQSYLSINKDIADLTGNDHDKAIASINQKAETYRKGKVDELKISELTSNGMIALYQKEQEEKNNLLIGHYQTIGDEDAAYYLKLSMDIDNMLKKGVASYSEINTFREDSDKKYTDKRLEQERSFYSSLNTLAGDWYTNESIKIGEQYSVYEKQGRNRLELEQWLNDSMRALDKDRFDKKKTTVESYEDQINKLSASTVLTFQPTGDKNVDAFSSMINALSQVNKMYEDQMLTLREINKLKYQLTNDKELPEAEKARILKQIPELEARNAKLSLKHNVDAAAQALGASKLLVGEKSKAYTAISAMEKAAHIASLTMTAEQQAADLGKALTSAVASVTASGSGDPYTAIPRVIAMTALMASTLGQIGVSFGGGGGGSSGGSSASYTPPAAYSGTVLGDTSKVSESTTKIVDILGSIHISEYSQLRDINRAVTSMSENINSAITNIFRTQGGFSASSFASQNENSIVSMTKSVLNTAMDSATNIANKLGGPLTQALVNSMNNSLGKVMGSIASKAFGGGTSTSLESNRLVTGSNTVDSYLNGGSAGAYYSGLIHTHKDGGWFGSDSDSYRNLTQGVDASVQSSITAIYRSLSDTLMAVSEGVGQGTEAKAKAYQFGALSIETLGKTSEQIVTEMNNAISSMGDQMISGVFNGILTQYQHLGEGLLETAVRVVVEKEVILQDLANVNKSITGNVLDITQSLVDLSGGLTKFSDANSSYFDNYFSDAEKSAIYQKNLESAYKSMNITMPTTIAGFRSTVDALDLNTASGRDTYVSLMNIADAQKTYMDSLKALTKLTAPKDMMLSRANDATYIGGKTDGTVNVLQLDALNNILREFQTQTRILQLTGGIA